MIYSNNIDTPEYNTNDYTIMESYVEVLMITICKWNNEINIQNGPDCSHTCASAAQGLTRISIQRGATIY